MSRIDNMFQKLKEDGKKGFIAYITAGDPTIDFTEKLIYALDEAGVDLLELGVPFSDPLADGPVIQEAFERALARHTNLTMIFDIVKKARSRSSMPVILFTYLNPVYQYGIEKFAGDCAIAGVDGVLVLDMPPEESGDYINAMRLAKVDTIFIISPTTDFERIKVISDISTGFIYYVSRMGVTGEKNDIDSELENKVKMIKSITSKPIAVGFGVSNPDQVSRVASHAEAVIVGSAIVRRVKEFKDEANGYINVALFVKNLIKPLK